MAERAESSFTGKTGNFFHKRKAGLQFSYRIRLPFAGSQWETGSYRRTGRQPRASATNGKLQASASCSRAVLNGVNGTVLFEGTCKESLQAKSVNGSVKLYLPHDLSGTAVSASTVTGKIRLTENGKTSSFSRHFTQKSDVSSRTIQASTVNGNVTLSDQPDKD